VTDETLVAMFARRADRRRCRRLCPTLRRLRRTIRLTGPGRKEKV